MKKILLLLPFLLLGGCYQDTINSFSTFTFQFIVNLNTIYFDRMAPSVSLDFTNLNKYYEYHENKDKISKSQLLQFNFWIDSLVLENNQPYDPKKDNLEFEYVIYSLVFARPIAGNVTSDDPNDFEPDPTIQEFELGRFTNANVRDFYRKAHHIIDIPPQISDQIGQQLLTTPYFYIKTSYGKVNGSLDKHRFPFLKANFDLAIRFKVDLKE